METRATEPDLTVLRLTQMKIVCIDLKTTLIFRKQFKTSLNSSNDFAFPGDVKLQTHATETIM